MALGLQSRKPRVDTDWPAVWGAPKSPRTRHGIVRDVSESGIFLELPGNALDRRLSHLDVECLLPNGAIGRIAGSIVWHGEKRGRRGVGVHLSSSSTEFSEFVRTQVLTGNRKKKAPVPMWADSTASQLETATFPKPPAVEIQPAVPDQSVSFQLVVMNGSRSGSTYEVTDEVVIGRDPACDVVLLDSRVSRRHCRFYLRKEQLWVADLGSRNGVVVAGRRVEARPVVHGDKILVGDTLLKVFRDDALGRQLRHAQKLEALGRFAAGAAHDFNNILAVVTASASLLSEQLFDPKLKHLADRITDATFEAAKVTRQMLGIARRPGNHPRHVDLKKLLEASRPLLSRRGGASVDVSLEIEEAYWVLADAGELEQVFLNLLNNAFDAMPDGGHLRVALKPVPSARERGLRPGNYVEVLVKDSGTGMDKETLANAFEPYFTTKSADVGTGLGLAMVQGIVERLDGVVVVNSELGKGTTIRVFLPRSEPPAESPAPESKRAPRGLANSDRVVLVVDDDEAVRRSLSDMIDFLGYQVIQAADGIAAIRLIEETCVDLAVVDIRMPLMSGIDVAEGIRRTSPETELLLCTGCNTDEVAGAAVYEILDKPVNLSTLAEKLSERLSKERLSPADSPNRKIPPL